jgi:lysophospholipid acyltransferase (LPLAT)-like uncharacterized protein
MGIHINWLSPIKRCLARALAFLLKLWTKTLSVAIDEESLRLLEHHKNTSKICALWHNRLFIAAHLFQKYFQDTAMYGLISPSRDGAWLSEIYTNMGIRIIRGSSKRGGSDALLAMINTIRAGHSVAITPDGPRGPCYHVKPGIAILAKETQTPIMLVSIDIPRAWQVNSWDRFYIPKPFSTISVTIHVLFPENYAGAEELCRDIECTLHGKT